MTCGWGTLVWPRSKKGTHHRNKRRVSAPEIPIGRAKRSQTDSGLEKGAFRGDGWAGDSVEHFKQCSWYVRGRLFCAPTDWRPRGREVVDACEPARCGSGKVCT